MAFKMGGGFKGGGGFRGGGFKSSGFKSSGFKSSGGFKSSSNRSFNSSPARSSSRSSFNSTGRRSSGVSLGDIIIGSIIGNSLSNQNRTQTTQISKNDVYSQTSTNQPSYTPPVAPRVPQYKEYMECEYCNSRYNDLKKDKCDNCGGTLTRKRESLNAKPSSATVSTPSTPKKKTGIVVAVIAIVLVVVIIALVIGGANSTNFSVYYTASLLDIYSYEEGTIDKTMSAPSYLIDYKVNFAQIVSDLSQFGYEEEGVFCIVNLTIMTREEIGIGWAEFTLEIGGYNYLAAKSKDDDTFSLNEWGEEGYFTVEGNETAYLIFPLDKYYSLEEITLEYRDLSDDNIIFVGDEPTVEKGHRIPLGN